MKRELLVFLVLVGCSDSATSGARSASPAPDAAAPAPPPGTVDWNVVIDPTAPAGKVASALLGQYDLSGALYAYDAVPGLAPAMREAGMKDWRVGLGRWEVSTQLLPNLTDGAACMPSPLLAAPPGATDLSLSTARDWFVDDGQPVTLAATKLDARYALGYLRSVLAVAARFGATPLVNVDHMPRAFAANRSFARAKKPGVDDPCSFTWTNGVSNCAPAAPYVADPIFASAVVGLVERVPEVTDWELWNEPDLPYAWDPSCDDATHARYFAAMVGSLRLLAAYRTESGRTLRFGIGSFAHADYAVAALQGLDGPGEPVDFFSFHSYSNDPLVIVADIAKMVAARRASVHYQKAELALTEWGVDLAAPADAASMTPSLVVATVLALGATLGLDRAYHSLFYDFVPGLPFGLVDHDAKPKPLYRAYTLLAKVLAAGGDRFAVADDGRFDAGQGAALAVRDPGGALRVLLVNRNKAPRSVRVTLGGAAKRPATVLTFDTPATDPRSVPPTDVVVLAPESVTVLEL